MFIREDRGLFFALLVVEHLTLSLNCRIAYLQDVPRTIMEADTLEKLLKVTPRDQWEDPPEEIGSYIEAMEALENL